MVAEGSTGRARTKKVGLSTNAAKYQVGLNANIRKTKLKYAAMNETF